MKRILSRTALLHAGVWAVLFGLNLPLLLNAGVSHPVGRTALVFGQLVGLYYANGWLVDRLYERGRRLPYLLVANALVWLAALLIRTLDAWLLHDGLATVFPTFERYRSYTWVLCAVIVLTSFFWRVLHHRAAEQRRQQAIIARQQEAQLQYLRSQINPHFLFNTLNNLYALAVAQAPQTAETVLRLSNLLRFAIYSSREPLIPLAQELAQVRELLWLDDLRRETPANVTLTVDGDVHAAWLEPMLLLPLVENCLKHGDLDLNPAAYLRLHLRVAEGLIVFRAENSYDPGPQQSKDAHPGVGLANVRQRLALQHPDGRATLRTAAHPAELYFEAELRVPQELRTPAPAPAATLAV